MNGWKFATASLLSVLLVACSGNGDLESATAELDQVVREGPGRVVARSGQIALDGAQGEFNFSIELPAGWRVTERFTADPSHAAAGQIWNADGPVVQYEALSGPPELPINVQRRPHVVAQERNSGVETTVFEPAPEAAGAGYQTGILFSELPGTPDGASTLPLVLSSLPGRPEVQYLVLDVARTVRFAPPPTPPRRAKPAVTPGPDWTRVDARTGLASTANFSLVLPPGWMVEERIGIDTLTGSIRGNGIEIYYDFGDLAGTPEAAQTGIFHWQEEADGELIHLFRPTDEPNHPGYLFGTGAYFPILPGSGADTRRFPLYIAAAGLDESQQEIVLAIVRTIRDAELEEAR